MGVQALCQPNFQRARTRGLRKHPRAAAGYPGFTVEHDDGLGVRAGAREPARGFDGEFAAERLSDQPKASCGQRRTDRVERACEIALGVIVARQGIAAKPRVDPDDPEPRRESARERLVGDIRTPHAGKEDQERTVVVRRGGAIETREVADEIAGPRFGIEQSERQGALQQGLEAQHELEPEQ